MFTFNFEKTSGTSIFSVKYQKIKYSPSTPSLFNMEGVKICEVMSYDGIKGTVTYLKDITSFNNKIRHYARATLFDRIWERHQNWRFLYIVWANNISSLHTKINGHNSPEPFWCHKSPMKLLWFLVCHQCKRVVHRKRVVHLDFTRGLTVFLEPHLLCHSAAMCKKFSTIIPEH